MRLNVQPFQDTGMLADWIVIPRSRSAGKKSVVVLPVSTVPAVGLYDEAVSIDSVSVVFPESTKCVSRAYMYRPGQTHRYEP